MDPMLSTALFAGAEAAINAALGYDPASRIALSNLQPQVLAIQISSPSLRIYLVPVTDGISLRHHFEGEITTELSGTLPALMNLLRHNTTNLKGTGVQVKGSLHFLAQLQSVLRKLEIDWEDMLSRLFGDVIAHQSATFLRNQFQWTKDRAANAQRLASEFLTEELRALPAKSEVQHFNRQVDELRLDVDRLAARLALLAKALQ